MSNEDDDNIAGEVLAPPTPDAIKLEGILKKKSPKGFFKAWQERSVVLTDQGLFYYKKRDGPHQGAIPLHTIACVRTDPEQYKKKGFRFDIFLMAQWDRVFSFIAKTEAEVTMWVDAVSSAVEEYQKKTQSNNPILMDAKGAKDKIWKNLTSQPNAQKVQRVTAAKTMSDDMQALLASFKPLYQLTTSSKTDGQALLTQLLSQLSDYKIVSDLIINDLGSVYLIGNTHYTMTHRSYILHNIEVSNLHQEMAIQCMQLYRDVQWPLFPTLIHCGETMDSVYSIYHPPLRFNYDSLFHWLERVGKIPEPIVSWLLVHILLTLDFLHNNDVIFSSLSPEVIFFDADGVVRFCDLFLSKDKHSTLLARVVPDYVAPETITPHTYIFNAENVEREGDFWKLGALLFELSTGLPPFRLDVTPDQVELDPNQYNEEIYKTIRHFNPNDLRFPDFVSQDLRSLILALLQPDPSKRLTNIDEIKNHPFMKAVEEPFYDIDFLLCSPRPKWVVDQIMTPLCTDFETTPQNLGYMPEPATLQNLVVTPVQARYLPIQASTKLHFNIYLSLDGDVRSTRQYAHTDVGVPLADYPENFTTSATLNLYQEQFSFYVLNSIDSAFYPDVVIELHSSKVTRDAPIASAPVSATTPTADKSTLVACCSIPLIQIKRLQSLESWFTLVDTSGLPCGEVLLRVHWECEKLDIQTSQLAMTTLTNTSAKFPEFFGEVTSQHSSNRLWSLIVDPLAAEEVAHGGGAIPLLRSPEDTEQSRYTMNQQQSGTTGNNANGNQNGLTPIPLGQLPPNASLRHMQRASLISQNGGPAGVIGYPSTPTSTAQRPAAATIVSQHQAYDPNGSPAFTPSSSMNMNPPSMNSQDSLPLPPLPPVPPSPRSMAQKSVTSSGGTSSAAQEDPENNPALWRPCIDKQSGSTYYYNKITKSVRWETPECWNTTS